MAFALIDPNWGLGDVVILDTISESRKGAIDLAETYERVSLWSGYSKHPLPKGTRGSITNLEAFGYRIAEVDIHIKEPDRG